MTINTELATMSARELQIVEYRGERVVTTEQLAAGYGTDIANIKMNYSRNTRRFAEGKHFFKVSGQDLVDLRVTKRYPQISSKTRSLMLWTERGAANHAKMLETDQAWNFYNDLTEFYFTRRNAIASPSDLPALSRLEILQMAIEAETGRIAEKQRADKAERTKGQISRKREATALGRLSAANRRCRELEERLGESTKDATITKVENATGIKKSFKYVELRKWCRDNGIEARNVADERYGSVKSWPAGAWLAVYGIDLIALFGVRT